MAIPRVLVIAGSDSGGGAGIQADLKTVMALGGFATTAITAVTAQNTRAVTRVDALPADAVVAQIDAVLGDIGADAIKIGMIGSAAVASAVAERLERDDARMPLVFDPVMVATSGGVLADADTVRAFDRLMRRAAVVTPNLPELDALAGGDGQALAERIATAVLAKGGHGEGVTLTDRLHRPGVPPRAWADTRIGAGALHGTGCTLASAIATGLAHGAALEQAIDEARAYLRGAIARVLPIGGGARPLDHRPAR